MLSEFFGVLSLISSSIIPSRLVPCLLKLVWNLFIKFIGGFKFRSPASLWTSLLSISMPRSALLTWVASEISYSGVFISSCSTASPKERLVLSSLSVTVVRRLVKGMNGFSSHFYSITLESLIVNSS